MLWWFECTIPHFLNGRGGSNANKGIRKKDSKKDVGIYAPFELERRFSALSFKQVGLFSYHQLLEICVIFSELRLEEFHLIEEDVGVNEVLFFVGMVKSDSNL